jgi:hypothetical protein
LALPLMTHGHNAAVAADGAATARGEAGDFNSPLNLKAEMR